MRDRPMFAVVVGSLAQLVACGEPSSPAGDTIQTPALIEARVPQPPRLLAPLSASISTSRRPLFQWQAAGRSPVAIEVCRDRGCRHPVAAFVTRQAAGRPPVALPPGIVYWRALSLGGSSATWELKIPARDSGRTGSWGAIPDFNGDGFGDLAIGVKGPNQMRIFPGGPGGPPSQPAQTLTGPTGFGDEAGPAGDLDGDGYCDLAVWTSGPPVTVTVYRGGPDGPTSPVTFAGPDANFFDQMRVVSAGDVNGDGYGDLLVGGQNAAALYLGGPNGVATAPAETLPPVDPTAPDARWPMPGDFNGDGHPDAVIGGFNGDELYTGDGQRLVAQPGVTFPGDFGAPAGDFNGDGFADLAIDAVLAGGPGGPTPFQAIAGEYFYQGVGDVNGDGFSDVLSMVSSNAGVLEAERLYLGGPTACTSTDCPSFVPLLIPGHENDGHGSFVVLPGGVGDLNGDGFDDFAYVSPGQGAAYVFYGSASGPPQTPSLTITAEQGFGFSLARL